MREENGLGLAEQGALLLAQGRPSEALPLLARALQADPDDSGALHNLAAALQAVGEHRAAEVVYTRLLASGRAGANSWADYGLLLLRLDRPEEAVKALAEALPALAEDRALRGLQAQAALACGRWRDAVPHLEACLALEEDSRERAWNRAALDLLAGRWDAGWAGFEARWYTRQRRTEVRTYPQPTWDGAPFGGRTMLLWPEQGLGDTLLALRYLGPVLALGGEVVLQVQSALRPLVPSLPGLQCRTEEETLPAFDLQAPLLSLPPLLRDAPDATRMVPYLATPEADSWREGLQARLDRLPPGPRVGLAWRGGDAFAGNPQRSLTDTAASSLLSTADVQWVALQAGQVCPWSVALDLGPELTDFRRTAQALAALDLVVTVDTATANLAGGMGLEAWVLLHLSCDWRWMLGGERTPWYPTLRLFRQRRSGDWAEVVSAVQSALREGRGTC